MVALLIALFLLVVGAGLLLFGADWFVDGASELARALVGVRHAATGTRGDADRSHCFGSRCSHPCGR